MYVCIYIIYVYICLFEGTLFGVGSKGHMGHHVSHVLALRLVRDSAPGPVDGCVGERVERRSRVKKVKLQSGAPGVGGIEFRVPCLGVCVCVCVFCWEGGGFCWKSKGDRPCWGLV